MLLLPHNYLLTCLCNMRFGFDLWFLLGKVEVEYKNLLAPVEHLTWLLMI